MNTLNGKISMHMEGKLFPAFRGMIPMVEIGDKFEKCITTDAMERFARYLKSDKNLDENGILRDAKCVVIHRVRGQECYSFVSWSGKYMTVQEYDEKINQGEKMLFEKTDLICVV